MNGAVTTQQRCRCFAFAILPSVQELGGSGVAGRCAPLHVLVATLRIALQHCADSRSSAHRQSTVCTGHLTVE